jgi:hypothetical protein
MRATVALAIVLSMAVLAPCSAKENYREKQVNAQTKEAFADVSQNVRRQMDQGGKYEFVPTDERAKIDKSFGEMTALFDQYGTVSAMSEDAKIALFNNQEIVNSILTKRDRDRVICTKKAPIGSHIQQTNCHTYEQEVLAQSQTQKQLDDWKVMGCAGSPGGRGNATQSPIGCSYRGQGEPTMSGTRSGRP